jgi:hypothetical protein
VFLVTSDGRLVVTASPPTAKNGERWFVINLPMMADQETISAARPAAKRRSQVVAESSLENFVTHVRMFAYRRHGRYRRTSLHGRSATVSRRPAAACRSLRSGPSQTSLYGPEVDAGTSSSVANRVLLLDPRPVAALPGCRLDAIRSSPIHRDGHRKANVPPRHWWHDPICYV